jgi:thiamine-phosphate pyrophosphorylase
MKSIDWNLCLIADTEFASGRDIVSIVEDAVEGGVKLVQLRAKNLPSKDFLELALKLATLLKEKDIPLIINDRVDIVLSCDATGVHLGQQDLPIRFARKILGKDKLIGISVNTVEEAMEAEDCKADYLGVGPVFPTSTKKEMSPALGVKGFKAIRDKIKIPVLAIGGISVENAGKVMAAGADGIAVISAILGEKDTRRATGRLLEKIAKI